MTWEWEPDGSLTTHLSKPAFAEHPLTSERVYFNHVLWHAGDNIYTGHGRTPFTGHRDVQVALID